MPSPPSQAPAGPQPSADAPWPLAIVRTDAGRRVTFCNPAFEAMFLYSRREVTGKTLEALIKYTGDQATRKDGTIVQLESFIAPDVVNGSRVGYLYVLHDVAARRRVEEALSAAEQKFSRLFQGAPVAAMLATSIDLKIVDVNEAWTRLTGFSREEGIGRTAVELRLFEDPRELDRLNRLAELHKGSVTDLPCRLRTHDAVVKAASVSCEEIEAGDQPIRIVLAVDLTPLKEAEAALEEASQKSTEVRHEERHRIAQDLHDDISQRLALLQMGIDRLKSASPAPKGHLLRQIDELSAETAEIVRAMRSVVYDLHPPERPEAGLGEALEKLCDALGSQLNLDIKVSTHDLPATVRGEVGTCIIRVVQEAVSNTAKHGHATRVRVAIWRDQRDVCFSIKDDGRGFNVDAHREGIGLMTMVERTHALKGELWVLSRPRLEAGTLIAGRLPLAGRASRTPSAD